jgi:nucleoid-associated protein YgaU
MKGTKALGLAVAAALALTAGCTRVRTYVVEKDRVDQDLSAGNRGYIVGGPPAGKQDRPRKLTRQTYVTEVELPDLSSSTARKSVRLVEEVSSEPGQELIREASEAAGTQTPGASAGTAVTTYTVQNSDTLQKISRKVYGTSKKWRRIYEANTEQLESPDRIYVGQVLKIPQG